MAMSALRKPSVNNMAKKKVSIILPPMYSTITSPSYIIKEREKRDRARTLSVKSVSTIHSSGESEQNENINRIERFELRRLRHSTMLGLPSGFTLASDSFVRHSLSEWHDKLRINQESKTINYYHLGQVKLNNAVPILNFRVAVVCLILNIMCPGLGTLTAAFSCLIFPCNDFVKDKRCTFFTWNVAVALSQVVGVVYLLIGYFWGIIWGVYMVQIAERSEIVQDVPVINKNISKTFNKSVFCKRRVTEVDEDDVIENLVRVV